MKFAEVKKVEFSQDFYNKDNPINDNAERKEKTIIHKMSMKCPECGAMLEIDDQRETAFCTYCGCKMYIQNENNYLIRSEHKTEQIIRNIDDAQIYRAETERFIKGQNSFQRLSAGSILGVVLLVIGFIIVLITRIINRNLEWIDSFLLTVMGLGIFLCGVFVFYKLRRIDREE
ncbi:MAG: hypothetical protein IK014_03245 [Lachnospiraceae bacterium]|nr:hypothetical protein [Lachnospiraceae bacterium]